MGWTNGWKVTNLMKIILMNTKKKEMKKAIKSQFATAENQFIQTTFSLKRKMNWWREQSIQEDKGGSFNLELYLDYLSEQDFNQNKTFEDEKI
jgi:hypothetical protein